MKRGVNMKNTGLHHVSVLSGDIRKAYYFYHNILGILHTWTGNLTLFLTKTGLLPQPEHLT